jgi:hypothetical protein
MAWKATGKKRQKEKGANNAHKRKWMPPKASALIDQNVLLSTSNTNTIAMLTKTIGNIIN